jgi:hypothetical protein
VARPAARRLGHRYVTDELSELYLVMTCDAGFGRVPDTLKNLILGVRPIEVDDGYAVGQQTQPLR